MDAHITEWLDSVDSGSPLRVVDQGLVLIPFPPSVIAKVILAPIYPILL